MQTASTAARIETGAASARTVPASDPGTWLGIGLYTTPEVAELLHERTATIRRWAFGYARRDRDGVRIEYPPLIQTELPVLEGTYALTFVEMVELIYVRALRQVGASWTAIREAGAAMGRVYGSRHPFALQGLFADPGKLLHTRVREAKDAERLPQLIAPYLEQLEFGEDGHATRWWPLGKAGGVMIDPAYSFGAPRIAETGIRANTLSDTYLAELKHHGRRTVDHVAWTFEISPSHVDAALKFRRWLLTPA